MCSNREVPKIHYGDIAPANLQAMVKTTTRAFENCMLEKRNCDIWQSLTWIKWLGAMGKSKKIKVSKTPKNQPLDHQMMKVSSLLAKVQIRFKYLANLVDW